MKRKILIAGVDEVGRGSWAGPLVAAAVILRKQIKYTLADSKILSKTKREFLASVIKENSYWSIGIVSNKEIDALGLQQANILAASRAIDNLPIKPEYIKLDYLAKFSHAIPFELIIDGDAKVPVISAASIVAKVYRDNLMNYYHQLFVDYGFNSNVGYGTKRHQQGLKKAGVSVLHRISYKPVQKYRKKK